MPAAAADSSSAYPSSSSASSVTTSTTSNTAISAAADSSSNPRHSHSNGGSPPTNAMQSWWESISQARSRILALAEILNSPDLPSLADTDRPARSLLDSPHAYDAVAAALSASSSGSGDDPLCHWLYDTFQSSDPDLRLVALSFVPLVAGLYLSCVVSSSATSNPISLAGFEAILLALYAAETKVRAGKPLLVAVPDLSLPSLYHSPRPAAPYRHSSTAAAAPQPSVGVLSPPLEPQVAVKSTKRACIVGVALDSYYKKIAVMPGWSKIDLCEFVAAWAGQDCPCRTQLDEEEQNPSSFYPTSMSSSTLSPQIRNFADDDGRIGRVIGEMGKLGIRETPSGSHCNGEVEGDTIYTKGSRVPLPWELLQPVLRILGHCLLGPLNTQEVRDAASMAVRCVYARASHDLVPQVILATRSLIQLDKSARKAAKSVVLPRTASNPNTPSKPKKPEVFLVSK